MKIDLYNPTNGSRLAEDVRGINFGTVVAGQHSLLPVLIKPEKTVEDSFSAMKLFLQSNGGLNHSNFGHYKSDSFVSGIDHSNHLTGHFLLATGVTGTTYTGVSGVDISIASGVPQDYVWLDVQTGGSEIGSTSAINFRFVFDYT
jgi:hypothetical protein